VRKSEGKKQFGRHKHRRKDKIETKLIKKRGYVLDLCGSGEGQLLDCSERGKEIPNSMQCTS
jgi:hypothetical protein